MLAIKNPCRNFLQGFDRAFVSNFVLMKLKLEFHAERMGEQVNIIIT
jgi:hypothetical protein